MTLVMDWMMMVFQCDSGYSNEQLLQTLVANTHTSRNTKPPPMCKLKVVGLLQLLVLVVGGASDCHDHAKQEHDSD